MSRAEVFQRCVIARDILKSSTHNFSFETRCNCREKKESQVSSFEKFAESVHQQNQATSLIIARSFGV